MLQLGTSASWIPRRSKHQHAGERGGPNQLSVYWTRTLKMKGTGYEERLKRRWKRRREGEREREREREREGARRMKGGREETRLLGNKIETACGRFKLRLVFLPRCFMAAIPIEEEECFQFKLHPDIVESTSLSSYLELGCNCLPLGLILSLHGVCIYC